MKHAPIMEKQELINFMFNSLILEHLKKQSLPFSTPFFFTQSSKMPILLNQINIETFWIYKKCQKASKKTGM
jgi:hypothetical protein